MTASYVLSITSGTPVQLSTAVAANTPTNGYSFLSLQALAANSAVIYVAGAPPGKDMSTSLYGFRIEIPVSSIPAAPNIIELARGNIDLSEWWVKGTNGDKLAILVMA